MSGAVPLLALYSWHGQGQLHLHLLILSSHFCLHLKPLHTRFSDQNCMLLTYISFCLSHPPKFSHSNITSWRVKIKIFLMQTSIQHIWQNVCVCAHARTRMCQSYRVKKIPYWVKMLDWVCISSYIVCVKTAGIGYFLGQTNFNKVVKIVFFSVFIWQFWFTWKNLKSWNNALGIWNHTLHHAIGVMNKEWHVVSVMI